MGRLLHVALATAVVAATTIGPAAALYYASRPANPSPDNASPPPEGIGLIFGAFLGCALGVALLVAVYRDLVVPVLGWSTAIGAGCLIWVAAGSDTFSDRGGVAVFAVVELGIAGALGLAVGLVVSRLLPRGKAARRGPDAGG
jgi:hypothetical protein